MMRALQIISRAEKAAVIAVLVIMLAVIFLDILGRELWGEGLYWADRAGVYGFIYVTFLGLPLATEAGRHIRPKILECCLNQLSTSHQNLAIHGLAAGINGALGCVAFLYLLGSFRLGEYDPVTGIPLWLVMLAIPYGFFSAMIRHLGSLSIFHP